MKSVTIYLHEEDFEKVRQIAEERRMGLSQFYRELTQLGITIYNGVVPENHKSFCGMGEDF